MLKRYLDRFEGIIDGSIVPLGHSINNAAKNMGIDEAMMRLSDEKSMFFIRTYEFEKDTIILSSSDSVKNILRSDNLDITRRITAGKPIYIDGNVLSYSITGPMRQDTNSNPEQIHRIYGSMIAKAIESTLNNNVHLSLGNAYSIRFNDLPIVGNGQHLSKMHSFVYHGIIAVGPWDYRRISESLKLLDSDSSALSTLPSISTMNGSSMSITEYKKRLSDNIIRTVCSFFSNSYTLSTKENDELNRMSDAIAREKYTNAEWIARTDIALREDSRFCLLYEG